MRETHEAYQVIIWTITHSFKTTSPYQVVVKIIRAKNRFKRGLGNKDNIASAIAAAKAAATLKSSITS